MRFTVFLLTRSRLIILEGMNTSRFALLALLSLGLFAPSARAELHDCNGVWTNRPCDAGQSESTLKEKAYREQSEAERTADRKRFIFNELDLRRLKAIREQNISLAIETVRDACMSAGTSLADCQKEANDANAELDKRIAAVVPKEQPKAKEKEEAPTQTVVTVIDNTYIDRGRRFSHDREGHQRHFEGKGIKDTVELPDNSTIELPSIAVPENGKGKDHGKKSSSTKNSVKFPDGQGGLVGGTAP
jgi:hypothetical protein